MVFTHIARGFDEDLFRPKSNDSVQPRILQYPIIRVAVQGRIGVAIFSLVTGYVCALKPIRQFREGNQAAAFKGISKSAFRRAPRLVLPTSIATCLIWFFCQFGAFEMAKRANSWWLNDQTPTITPYIGEAIKSLLHALISTWTVGWNPYDENQWTLPPLLKGAMLVYVMLFATSFCKTRYRMLIQLGLFVFFYACNDRKFLLLNLRVYILIQQYSQRCLECNSFLEPFFPKPLNHPRIWPGVTLTNGLDASSRQSSFCQVSF